MSERYEVFTLGKHFLQIHTEKGFTLYANAKLVNGKLTSYTDKLTRRGGSWTINVWKFLSKKEFPINPIYTAVFGFDSDDTAVSVNGTDIDADSISGVNGQLVDIGNISLPDGQSLAINAFGGFPIIDVEIELDSEGHILNLPDGISNGNSILKIDNFCLIQHADGGFVAVYNVFSNKLFEKEGNTWVNHDVASLSLSGNNGLWVSRIVSGGIGSIKISNNDLHTNSAVLYCRVGKIIYRLFF